MCVGTRFEHGPTRLTEITANVGYKSDKERVNATWILFRNQIALFIFCIKLQLLRVSFGLGDGWRRRLSTHSSINSSVGKTFFLMR